MLLTRPSTGWGERLAFLAANVVLVAVIVMEPRAAAVVVVAAVGLPLLAAIARRPQYGILVLVALSPFNGLLLITPHPGLVNAWKEALVVWTLIGTFLHPAAARRAGPRRPPWFWGLVGTIGAALLAAAVNFDPLRVALGFKITFFYSLAAWAVLRCPFERRDIDRLVTILMSTGIVVALVGIAQQVAGPVRMHQLGFEYNSTIRFSGGFFRSFSTFIQPFGFAFYTMAVLLICTPVALTDTKRRRNLMFLFCLPVIGLGMATSVVRGAFLGFGIGLAYLGGSRHRILLLAFPLALVSLLVLPGEVSSAALSSSSTKQRATGWAQNLKVLSIHPVGAGPGTSAAAADRLAKGPNAKNYQPDNYYYHLAYEDGFAGAWFFILLLASGFYGARRRRADPDPEVAAFFSGGSAFLLAAAGASVVASFFEIFPMDVLTWVLLGLVTAFRAPVEDGEGAAKPALRGYYPSS